MPQENVSFQQLFDQALSAQQQKNGDEALKLYQESLDKGQSQLSDPQASVIYHNMSTLAFEKSDFLHAYVWSKKAITLDPSNRTAKKTLEIYSKKFETPMIAHQMSTSQNIQIVLEKIPSDLFFVLSLILLFTTLRLFYRYLIQRRQLQIEASTQKPVFWKSAVSFVLLFMFLLATGVRWHIDQISRAIITADKTGIQTAAGENKPVIYEAPVGTEVDVLQVVEDYAQVRYPGAFSGWVPKKNIEFLSRQLSLK